MAKTALRLASWQAITQSALKHRVKKGHIAPFKPRNYSTVLLSRIELFANFKLIVYHFIYHG